MSSGGRARAPKGSKRPASRGARARRSKAGGSESESARLRRAGCSEGEIKWHRIAREEGLDPLGTVEQIARGTPEEAEELLEVLRRSRQLDLVAEEERRVE